MTDEEMADKYAEEYFGKKTELVELWKVKSYKEAFLAGLKAGRAEWHDLRKNPNDLPKKDERFSTNISVAVFTQSSGFAFYSFDDKKWYFQGKIIDVIAWCEIPQFKEKESMFRKEAEDCEEQPKYCHDCAKFDEMPKGPRCKT